MCRKNYLPRVVSAMSLDRESVGQGGVRSWECGVRSAGGRMKRFFTSFPRARESSELGRGLDPRVRGDDDRTAYGGCPPLIRLLSPDFRGGKLDDKFSGHVYTNSSRRLASQGIFGRSLSS